ncbi:hypothetical protein MHYP_G00171750 [Metynnis hypsauchen]
MEAHKLPAAAAALLAVLLLSVLSRVSCVQFPDSHQAQEWAKHIQDDLVDLINAESGMEHLVKTFHDLKERYSVEENNAHQLVANAALNIENLLANRSKALKILAKKAEDLQMEHQWRDNITEGVINYYNAKDELNTSRQIISEFKEDPVFKRLVSYNSTAVHIPTDIYEGSEGPVKPADKI